MADFVGSLRYNGPKRYHVERAVFFVWRAIVNVQIPQDQLAMVESLVAAGRFTSLDEAVSEGIRLLASSEQLRQLVQHGVEQADCGDLVDHDTVFSQLRALAAEQTSGRR